MRPAPGLPGVSGIRRLCLAWWCVEDQLSELRLGFYEEYDATPALLPWVLGHGRTRIGPRYVAQVDELESYSSYLAHVGRGHGVR